MDFTLLMIVLTLRSLLRHFRPHFRRGHTAKISIFGLLVMWTLVSFFASPVVHCLQAWLIGAQRHFSNTSRLV